MVSLFSSQAKEPEKARACPSWISTRTPILTVACDRAPTLLCMTTWSPDILSAANAASLRYRQSRTRPAPWSRSIRTMPDKTVAIVQSNYIPWKGYFDLIAAADEFILYDDMQYTRRDWRNRNQIKTPQGVQWLTVPVQVKGKYHQTIRETLLDGDTWAQTHWKTLAQNYRRA